MINIVIAQQKPVEGWIVFKNNAFFLESNDKAVLYRIKASIDHLPVNQRGEFQFTLTDNVITTIDFTQDFRSRFELSHKLMSEAELLLSKKDLIIAQQKLDEIYAMYPTFPYLFSMYFTLADDRNDPEFIEPYIQSFEKYRLLLFDTEVANSYFRLYKFYLHQFDLTKDNAQRIRAIGYLKQSLEIKKDPERQALYDRLKKSESPL